MALLKDLNQKRWESCKINPNRQATFDSVAKRLSAPEAKARYQTVEKATGVPWWFIAVTHEREASQKWNTQLGQGDPLNRKSTHVPKGRGPFKTWEEGAIDALVNCAPFSARNKDWSVGNSLAELEKYNGLGYFKKGVPSPYIWAGTNQYVKGKYVADGVYDPNHVDTQLGCAGLLMRMDAFKLPLGSAQPEVAKQASVPTIAQNTSTGAASAVIVAGGVATAASQTGVHWLYIIAGVVVIGLLSLWAIHSYINRKV